MLREVVGCPIAAFLRRRLCVDCDLVTVLRQMRQPSLTRLALPVGSMTSFSTM